MKHLPAFLLCALFASEAYATTTASFDGGADTPITLITFDAPPGPSIEAAGGNPGGFLQLTPNVPTQGNFAAFDRSDAGAFASSSFTFQFRLDQFGGAGGADGFSFSYAPVSIYGASGSLPFGFLEEDPASVGLLGFGFDTWNNQSIDDPALPEGPDHSEMTVYYDNNLVSKIDDTRLLSSPLDLKDGAWHTVTGNVDFAGGTVNLAVDGNSLFSGVSVPGLAPFESRIVLAGRTGGGNERASIDNINTTFGAGPAVPDSGATLVLLGVGLLALGRISNRARA